MAERSFSIVGITVNAENPCRSNRIRQRRLSWSGELGRCYRIGWMKCLADSFPLKPPPMQTFTTGPFLPVGPGHGRGGHFGGGSGDGEARFNFPGGGINCHQSTQEWTDTLVQQAEGSMSLALAKPKAIENDNQSEVSGILYPARSYSL